MSYLVASNAMYPHLQILQRFAQACSKPPKTAALPRLHFSDFDWVDTSGHSAETAPLFAA